MKSVIIIGGGYSIKDGISSDLWNKIKDKEVWAINRAIFTMPYYPKRLLWIDKSFYETYKDIIFTYKYEVKLYTINDYKYPDYINQLSYTFSIRCDKDIFIGTTSFSGMFALSLAIKEEYNKIYLLGYDFGSSDNNTHYYLDNNSLLKNHKGAFKPEIYQNISGGVANSVKDFNKYKSYNIINVSPNSNIESFKKINYEQFYKEIE